MDIDSHEPVSGNLGLTCCLLMLLTYKDSVRGRALLETGLFFLFLGCFRVGLCDCLYVVASSFRLFE